jgi:hypothetical protein
LAKYFLPSATVRPKANFSTGLSALKGTANARFGSMAMVHVNSVPSPSASTS